MKKIVIGISIIVFIAAVVFISTFSMEDSALQHEGGHIPDNMGPFFLANKIAGEEAQQIMNKLHGKEIELENAYALEYQANSGSYALVWISESSQEGLTENLFIDMKKLTKDNKAYTNHTEKAYGDMVLQYALGNDRENYYYFHDNRFVFISVYEDKKDIFIKNAVKIF